MYSIRLPDWCTDCLLVQDVEQLPYRYINITNLYMDFETTSGEDHLKSINPWHNCELLGIALLVDDEPKPYYIPLRHRGPNEFVNLSIGNVLDWLCDTLLHTKYWINHNIKYDAHVLLNSGGIDFRSYGVELIDTLALCKLAPMEERFIYDLTTVMKEWLYTNIQPYEDRLKSFLHRGQYDYGLVPINIVAPYACVDVLSCRKIYKEVITQIPEDCNRVVEMEKAITPILFGIEQNGLQLNWNKLVYDYKCIPERLELLKLQIQLECGFEEMRPHTNADCKQLFVKQFGLPVVEWTEGKLDKKKGERERQPSFGKIALLAYKAMRPDLATLIDLMIEYKELHKLFTSFTKSYANLEVNRRIHSDYNQIVRTGRMSCRQPNAQQLSDEAKEYICPSEKDELIVDIDFNQIEFRLIAHYIQAESILKKYNEDPDTDYHQFVADLCNIKRKPAKRVNFMLGYGGGRRKCLAVLSSEPDIIEELKTKEEVEKRANEVYERYHQELPTLRPIMYRANNILRQRGFVRTLLGRRRYLPLYASYKAFNTIVQGSAADLFKAALVRVSQYLGSRDDIKLIGCVHDSFLFSMRKELVEHEVDKLIEIITEVPEGVVLRVPLRANAKISDKTWKDCK